MSVPAPGVYSGTLRHRRFRPRGHEFSYPVVLALLDVDCVPQLMSVSRLTSYNRWNWASFDERDHFGDPRRPLRERLEADAAAAGLEPPRGPIRLLTHLRYLGYAFNPVSFFYCYDVAGNLETVLAEVNNTFGETHNYWLTARERRQASGSSLRFATPKVFHVSPFMPLSMRYEWLFTPPGDRLVVHMNTLDEQGTVLDSTLSLGARPWSAGAIRAALLRHPWMTGKVIAAIHYQALRLWMKRAPFFPHPGSPPSVGHRRTPGGDRRRALPSGGQ